MKSNIVTYFFHDVDMRHDLKIIALMEKFGNDGYAVWCMLLEILTASKFEIKFNNKIIQQLSLDFRMDQERLSRIIDYMLEVGLVETHRGKLFSTRLKERMTIFTSGKSLREAAPDYGKSNDEIYNDLVDELKNSEQWLDNIQRLKKISKAVLINHLVEFLKDLKLKEDYFKNISDIKRHFINYLNKQLRNHG